MLQVEDLGIKAEPHKASNGESIWNILDVSIEGPKDTLYEGHTLSARIYFPNTYPYDPPTFYFVSDIWHPNVYSKDGKVCISILMTDRNEFMDEESTKCTWTPGWNIVTVCLGILSMLNEPNINSPANIDASKEYRDTPEVYKANVKKHLDGQK